jgi:hypothetical protein
MSQTKPLSYGAVINTDLGSKFRVDPDTTTGLTFGYLGGTYTFGSSEITVAAGTVTLTASGTNYVTMNRSSGSISVTTDEYSQSTGTTTLYVVTTDVSGITGITDQRAAYI